MTTTRHRTFTSSSLSSSIGSNNSDKPCLSGVPRGVNRNDRCCDKNGVSMAAAAAASAVGAVEASDHDCYERGTISGEKEKEEMEWWRRQSDSAATLTVRQRRSSSDDTRYVVYEYRVEDDNDGSVIKKTLAQSGPEEGGSDGGDSHSDAVSHLFPRLAAVSRDIPVASALHRMVSRCINYLLPQHFPHSVSRPASYLSYCKWQSLQYVLGSMGGVLSTQSLLYAVGIGSGSIPLAAALNWVIKDGLGQLGGVIFASRVSTNFDGDPKKWRFRGELAMILSTMLEICTPLVPQFFLPLASLANIGKNVSFLTASATRAAINLSFCNQKGNNLGDVTAKAGSQAITSSLTGTGLGIALAPLIGSSFSAVLPVFCVLACMHLYALYRAVSVVRLSSLNLQRIELVIHGFLTEGRVLTPDEVSQRETFVSPYRSPFFVPLIVNPQVDSYISTAAELASLRDRFEGRGYVLTVNRDKADSSPSVVVWLLEHADTESVICAMLHAGIIRKGLENNDMTDPYLDDSSATLSMVDHAAKKLLIGMSSTGWQMDQNHIDSNTAQRISFTY